MALPRLCVRPLTQRKQILAWQGGRQACGRRESSYAGFQRRMTLLDSLLILFVLRPDFSLTTLARVTSGAATPASGAGAASAASSA